MIKTTLLGAWSGVCVVKSATLGLTQQSQRVDYTLLLFPVVFLFHVINGAMSSAYGMPTSCFFLEAPQLLKYTRATPTVYSLASSPPEHSTDVVPFYPAPSGTGTLSPRMQ